MSTKRGKLPVDAYHPALADFWRTLCGQRMLAEHTGNQL